MDCWPRPSGRATPAATTRHDLTHEPPARVKAGHQARLTSAICEDRCEQWSAMRQTGDRQSPGWEPTPYEMACSAPTERRRCSNPLPPQRGTVQHALLWRLWAFVAPSPALKPAQWAPPAFRSGAGSSTDLAVSRTKRQRQDGLVPARPPPGPVKQRSKCRRRAASWSPVPRAWCCRSACRAGRRAGGHAARFEPALASRASQ